MPPTRSFQGPKGTRDFYPDRMAVLRHIQSAWRSASIDSGFSEIEGPMFEPLELYTVKSGQEIVSQLFSFRREGGEDDYALRPEFTPTLARMAAARGKSLGVPTKWFSIPNLFRAERPQRGRLREHVQWNVDVLGLDDASADVEVISTALLALERLGLGPHHIKVRLSHRESIAEVLVALGVSREHLQDAFLLMDRRDKIDEDAFRQGVAKLGLDEAAISRFDQAARLTRTLDQPLDDVAEALGVPKSALSGLQEVTARLREAGLADWCVVDTGIIRGLAYYTGSVFEIFDAQGEERAVAGGGRYDRLIELFGGPSTPACGFGMGDVVLSLVLEQHGLLGESGGESLLPRPDVFLVATGDEGERLYDRLLTTLRRAGIHARRTHKSTRNLGKLLSEATKLNARHAVVLGDELAEGSVILKDLDGGSQREVKLEELPSILVALVREGQDS
ncbi:MAG: histidine--tRNA ligase [Planctomycetota bacterium]|nr:histidine--tRNA ligase [Planctomycetota bacterium]